jgi:hypothetical protein
MFLLCFLSPTKLIDFLRDAAMSEKLIQPLGTHSDEPRAAALRMPHYFFLGRRVCRASLAVLMGVGCSPRLSNLLKAVLRGDRAAPVDVRYMTRKHNDPNTGFFGSLQLPPELVHECG